MTTTKASFKKEDKENLEKKLGEVLGLERAAQKAVEELSAKKLLKSDSKDQANNIKDEATSHEEKLTDIISQLTEDKEINLDKDKVEESAKETETKVTKIMKIYLGEEPDSPEAIEFLCLAEGGEVSHYEVLSAICKKFDNKKLSSTISSILKEEKEHLERCISLAKESVS